MTLFKVNDLKHVSDSRGSLTILNSNEDIPFEIKRVYFLSNLDSSLPRGFHAHYELYQAAICISGSCDLIFDDGRSRETLHLSSSCKSVLIPPLIWHEMHNFSADCVFMVVASAAYDESDYIRNYDNFLRIKSD